MNETITKIMITIRSRICNSNTKFVVSNNGTNTNQMIMFDIILEITQNKQQ